MRELRSHAISSTQGTVSNIEVAAREIARLRETVISILATNIGRSIEQIKLDVERDLYLDAEAAKDYELVDRIVQKIPR